MTTRTPPPAQPLHGPPQSSTRPRVAVAGATGLVGCLVVNALVAQGLGVVPIARALGVDLVTGGGLAEALAGCDTVIDVSNVVTTRRRQSVEFFSRATRNLLEAGQAGGIRHHVVLSIVGVDVVDFGYYEGKRVQEELVRSSSTPHTVLRATQFHEFAEQTLERMRIGPIAVVPQMRSQPVLAAEVADLLVEIARTGPGWSGGATMAEIAGPEELTVAEMVRRLKRARGDRSPTISFRVPGQAGRSAAHGGLLPAAGHHRGTVTFDGWLEDTFSASPRESAPWSVGGGTGSRDE